MSHDVLKRVPAKERKKLLASEAKRRRTGEWGPWETMPNPLRSTANPRGWLSQVETVHRNKVFSVLERHDKSGAVHLAVSSLSERRPTWWEMQRIKDEIAGPDATAVEVYPPQNEVVDEANMFHIWVVPEALPFTLY